MKKFCIVFIALALAVMIPYAAVAATYDYDEIGVGMTLYGGDIINIPSGTIKVVTYEWSIWNVSGQTESGSVTVKSGIWKVKLKNNTDVRLRDTKYGIYLMAKPDDGGYTEGAGQYESGTSCTLTATPATGYHFVKWTENDNEVSTNKSYSFTVTEDRLFVAYFKLDKHTISASSNPTAGGSASGSGTYDYGTSCTLTATPATGYHFVNWTENGNPVSTDPNYTFTLMEDRTLVANFELNRYDITVTTDIPAAGTVTGGGTYQHGQVCTVTANPNTGYLFSNWKVNSQVVSTDSNYSFTAENNVTVTATFKALKGVTLTADDQAYVYTGKPIEATGSYTCEPEGPVFAGISVLGKGTDAGTYDMDFTGVVIGTVDQSNEYYVQAVKKGKLEIVPKQLGKGWIEAIPDQTYTGSEIKPALTVYDPEVPQNLAEGKDYTVAYRNNTEIGTATATITAKGNYTGTDSVTWKIVKGEEKTHVHTVVTDEAVEPTCTQTGLTEGSHCSVCKEVLKKQEEIPALDHLLIAWHPDGNGNHVMTCERKCGYKDTQECKMIILPQVDPEAEEVSFCPMCGYCTGAKMTPVKGLKPLDGAPYGSLRAFFLEVGEKKYMTLSFDYSLTGELLQPDGEVTFTLPEEMKDTAFATVDTEGTEWPAEKTSENGVWTLKVDFAPEDKDPVKVMILSAAD